MTRGVDNRSASWDRRAAYYDVEQAEAEDTAFWASAVPASARRVLLVPSGTGRLLEPLARAGREVVLVDREPAMLEEAGRKAAALGPGSARVQLGELTKLGLCEAFDAIVVPEGAVQLVADPAAAIEELARHLAPGGVLLLEVIRIGRSAPRGVRFYDPAVPDGVWVDEWARPTPDGTWLARRRKQRHGKNGVVLRFAYTLAASRHGLERAATAWTASVALHALGDRELGRALEQARLRIARQHGDYDGSPYDAAAARRLLVLDNEEH